MLRIMLVIHKSLLELPRAMPNCCVVLCAKGLVAELSNCANLGAWLLELALSIVVVVPSCCCSDL